MFTADSDQYFSTDTAEVPNVRATQLVPLAAGERFEVRIAPVTKRIGDATVRMLAYNGSVPGPTLRVQQGSEVLIDVVNDGDLETTVHWHGLRLDNRYDGTTDTQAAIAVGGRFTYRLSFPDPGVYWYHPHIREDYGQEMGLYGNIIVVPSEPHYWNPANRELTLTLDDILLEHGKVAPFNRTHPTFTAMGRFGNTWLVNGDVERSIDAVQGEVVRLYLTNTANTRVFDLAAPGARMKLVGGDSGRYERETFVEQVLIAPSERAVVDMLFEEPGQLTLEHRTPHRTYALATFAVEPHHRVAPSYASQFWNLRVNSHFADERAWFSRYVDAAPDKTLSFVAQMDMAAPDQAVGQAVSFACPMHPEIRSTHADRCQKCGMKLVPAGLVGAASEQGHGHAHSDQRLHVGGIAAGIEWEDDMVDVNRMTTPANMRWQLIDRESGAEGPAIDWSFRVGDLVKIRLVNERDSDHPMHHPFHFHGAGRFLILSRDGVPESNLVWKDTVLVATSQTVDILLKATHPGVWMAHCHIAEHHESGMAMRFSVDASLEP